MEIVENILPKSVKHTHNGVDNPRVDFDDLIGINSFKFNYDPANLVDGAGETTTYTTKGAELGDFVVISFNKDLSGITATGYVSASGTTSVRLQNESGGTLNLASGSIKIIIIKS